MINSRAYAAVDVEICPLVPDNIKITSNGMLPVNNIVFEGVSYPHFIGVYYGKQLLHYPSAEIICHGVSGLNNTIQYCAGYGLGLGSYLLNADIAFIQREGLFGADAFGSGSGPAGTSAACFKTRGYSRHLYHIFTNTLSSNEVITYDDCDDPIINICFDPVPAVIAVIVNIDNINVLSAVSDEFLVYPFVDPHEFRVKNETTSLLDLFRDNDFTNILEREVVAGEIAFSDYMSAIFGTETDSPGIKIYKAIANFCDDTSDPDLATIDSFSQMIKMNDDNIKQFGLQYPDKTKRLMDSFSIGYDRLFGTIDCWNRNFFYRLPDDLCGLSGLNNLGEQITSNSIVSAGTEIVINPIDTDYYFTIHITSVSGMSSFPLSATTAGCLYAPLDDNYCFFRHNSEIEGSRICNYINFDMSCLKSSTTKNEFYDNSGTVETSLTFNLTDGLCLKV